MISKGEWVIGLFMGLSLAERRFNLPTPWFVSALLELNSKLYLSWFERSSSVVEERTLNFSWMLTFNVGHSLHPGTCTPVWSWLWRQVWRMVEGQEGWNNKCSMDLLEGLYWGNVFSTMSSRQYTYDHCLLLFIKQIKSSRYFKITVLKSKCSYEYNHFSDWGMKVP